MTTQEDPQGEDVRMPEMVLRSDFATDPVLIMRMMMSFCAATAIQQGNQMVISRVVWEQMQGKRVRVAFEERFDRLIMRVEVEDVGTQPRADAEGDGAPVDSGQ